MFITDPKITEALVQELERQAKIPRYCRICNKKLDKSQLSPRYNLTDICDDHLEYLFGLQLKEVYDLAIKHLRNEIKRIDDLAEDFYGEMK